MKARTVIGILLIVAGAWKLANIWGVIENDWLWSQPWTEYIIPIALFYLGAMVIVNSYRRDPDHLAAPSALFFFCLSKATIHARGTDAISRPRKNMRKEPDDIIVYMPNNVLKTNMKNSPAFFLFVSSHVCDIITTMRVPMVRIIFITFTICEVT